MNSQDNVKYQSSIHHALMFAENGEKVIWYGSEATGMAVPVITYPAGSGYCRKIYIQATAHNVTKTMDATACFDNGSGAWTWVEK